MCILRVSSGFLASPQLPVMETGTLLFYHPPCPFPLLSEYVGEWDQDDDPLVEHRNLFSHCPFMRGHNVGNIPILEDEEEEDILQVEEEEQEELRLFDGDSTPTAYSISSRLQELVAESPSRRASSGRGEGRTQSTTSAAAAGVSG